MWSKLIPKNHSEQATAFVYRTIGSPSAAAPAPQSGPGVAVARPSPTPSAPPLPEEVQRERDRLRARVAELEQGLAQQVAAARQAGLREGEAAGRAQSDAAAKPVLDRLARTIQELLESRPRLRKEIEEDAVQLSLSIARRILRREVSVDASALHGLIQAGFDRLGRAEIHRIIVHPDHVAPLRQTLAAFTTRQVEVIGDVSREKGALVFETNRGALDASIDSQLREIELGLADRMKSR